MSDSVCWWSSSVSPQKPEMKSLLRLTSDTHRHIHAHKCTSLSPRKKVYHLWWKNREIDIRFLLATWDNCPDVLHEIKVGLSCVAGNVNKEIMMWSRTAVFESHDKQICQLKTRPPTHGALPLGSYCSHSGLEGESACKCSFALRLVAKPGKRNRQLRV